MLNIGRVGFPSGRSSFLDALREVQEPTAKIYVKICLEGRLESSLYAQIDTGAAWSVLDTAVAESFGLLNMEGQWIWLDTRLGRMKGRLVRLLVTFPADEGIALDTNGTFFVSPSWPPGRTFLGYSGLLDSMRFALDPQANHFYFGSY